MHVAAETPGDHASILNTRQERSSAGEVSTTPAPEGSEYMDGDIFALIVGNDVCICTTGLREQSLALYLQELFKKANLNETSNQFDLQPVGNVDKLRLIAQGVKQIELGATVQEATVAYVRRHHEPRSLIGAFGREIRRLLGNDVRDIEDNLQVSISIYADGRVRSGRRQGDERLQALARDLVRTDGDDYSITTRAGQTISQNEIFVRTRVEMDGFGKSVSRSSAWPALRGFYEELNRTGVTAQ